MSVIYFAIYDVESKIYPLSTSQMLWFHDCPLNTTLLVSSIFKTIKISLIIGQAGSECLEHPLSDHKPYGKICLLYCKFSPRSNFE